VDVDETSLTMLPKLQHIMEWCN